jgi:mRNA interferase RelE/StbE
VTRSACLAQVIRSLPVNSGAMDSVSREDLRQTGDTESDRPTAPEAVAAAVQEFCDAGLADNPHRVGKPLFGPLAGCHGGRRGTHRIVYGIDESRRVVHVLDIDRRPEIYRRPPR